MRAAAIVPAYQAEPVIGEVLEGLMRLWPEPDAVFVIDDGSTDATVEVAERAGARVIRHPHNIGKGAALRTGMRAARHAGFDVAVTVDADGQHPPEEALRMHQGCSDPRALVLGIRDLQAANAPRNSQMSNRFSNLVLSGFTGRWLSDTQCGLRRYPIEDTLALSGEENGYGYEAEVIIRAAMTPIPIVELPIQVIYPPAEERISHFDSVRDPTKIVIRVLRTVASVRGRWLLSSVGLGDASAHLDPGE
jgi:glycosyltransferase involved in cell wall biosynthesis